MGQKDADRSSVGRDELRRRWEAAVAHEQRGEPDLAAAHYEWIVERTPAAVEARYRLGLVHLKQRRLGAAVDCLRLAVAGNPTNPSWLCNYAIALLESGATDQAVEALRRALSLRADFPEAHFNLGNALRRAGRTNEAIESYRSALAYKPDFVAASVALGATIGDSAGPDAALPYAERAVAIAPADPDALNNLGVTLARAGRTTDAIARYRAALAAAPGRADIHNNLGQTLLDHGEPEAARRCFEQAVRLKPDFLDARLHRGLAALALGDLASGWPDYLYRNSVRPLLARLHRDPLPEDLSGKRIHVIREGGLGDELIFLRFARVLHQRGAEILYEGDARLTGLIGALPFIAECVIPEARPAVELTVSAGDLPFLTGLSRPDDIPPTIELRASGDSKSAARNALLAAGPPPYVGVTWQAGPANRRRGVDVADLGRVLRDVSATVVALQRNPSAADLDRLADAAGRPVADLSRFNNDLDAMLGLLTALDHYVAISNTNVDLRQAAGMPSHVLVAHPLDFRWGGVAPYTPWFPGCTLHRQEAGNNWQSALNSLKQNFLEHRHES